MVIDENLYTLLLRKLGENRSFGRLRVDGRKILKWVLRTNAITAAAWFKTIMNLRIL
jgi:hypothetical protein